MTALLPQLLVPIAIAIGAFGLLVGSFLNVVVYRVPNGLSIVSPPSACPSCGGAILPRDNVPVLSWLLLGGKCRGCSDRISARYPLVELGTGLAFAAVAVWLVVSMNVSTVNVSTVNVSTVASSTVAASTALMLIAYLYLAAISIALALIDIDTHRLPNVIVLPSYLVAAALLAASALLEGNFGAILMAGIGGAGLGAFYLGLAFVYPAGMGFGDVKLAGLLGLYLGFLGLGPLLIGGFAAFVLGGVYSLALIATRRAGRKSGIPFGPWMLAGAWLGIVAGESLWRGYLGLIGF